MISSRNLVKILSLTILLGIIVSTSGFVGTASAKFIRSYNDSYVGSGSGLAGSGSLAVATLFSPSTLTGAGAFSGNIGGVATSGIFTLTVSNPSGTLVLPCASGEVSAGGTVVSGSLLGEQVIVAGCASTGDSPGSFVVYHATPLS